MAPRVVRGVLLVSALVAALGVPSPALGLPASRVDAPSWDEVLAARGDEAATAAAIGTLETLLDELQAEAARLGDTAIARAAEAEAAAGALQRATTTAGALDRQADAARQRADRSAAQAAQVAVALYRTAGTDLSAAMIIGGDANDLLYRLGTLDRVGDRVSAVLERAAADSNQVEALSRQAELARAERERLSLLAKDALAQARAAQERADAAVATQQASLDLLFAQLATLKNTTAQLEQEYRIGQQAANPGGAPGGGSSTGGGGSSGGQDSGGFVVPGNEVNDVAAARSYAWARVAQYGWGPEHNDCLLWLWNRESGWRTNAYNASSGAYGIPQSLPGSKMALAGADWRTNYETQINWGLIYINSRYGSPCGAWAHSQARGWY